MNRSGRASWMRQIVPLALLGAVVVLASWATSRTQIEPADYTFINGTEISSLDPATVTGVPEGRILRAIFEGLTIKHPRTLEPLPGMAASWTISDDGLVYTFAMREGAVWSNGDPVTAHDFVYSWKRFLSPMTAAEYAYQLWYVKGAEAFTTQVDDDGEPLNSFEETVGIRALDDMTLEVTLDQPTPFFLQLTAFYPLFPVNRRSIEDMQARFPNSWEYEWLTPENIVTNGAFRITERRIKDFMRLEKNALYWDADSVAFNTIDALAVENYNTNLNLYLQGTADWINFIPNLLVPRLLEREDFTPTPYFGSYFYRVNVKRPPFDDVRIRRALALTIDRRAITENITKSGQIPWHSLVPYGMEGYTPGTFEHAAELGDGYAAGFERDIEAAKQLIAEAGYGPGGKRFPTIEVLYNTSETHRDIAEVIADSWKRHLGVTVKLLNQEWKVYLDSQRTMVYDVSRSAWIGDYLDPNTFLDMFVTDGENNKTGWGNPRYDALIADAKKETDPARRFQLLQDAEVLLMEELPILPIYSYATQNMYTPRLGGFEGNLLDEHFARWWYWRSDKEVEARRALLEDPGEEVELHGPPEGQYPPNAPNGIFPEGDPRRELSPLSQS